MFQNYPRNPTKNYMEKNINKKTPISENSLKYTQTKNIIFEINRKKKHPNKNTNAEILPKKQQFKKHQFLKI